MQQAYRSTPQVPVRMGLHIGDIVLNDGQIFGDGVNLAARIESLGVAGSVLISDKVNDEIKNHPELKTRSAGSYQFKNILRKVEVFAIDHPALVIPKSNSLKGKTVNKSLASEKHIHDARKSIAVMAFLNMSNDPEQEYFSDGMAEEIINSLSHLKELKVSGRMSSFQFKDGKTSLQEVGEKLGVSSVLEGSVRKHGNKIRITAQLVNVDDGFQLWSEKYDRTIDDIFEIQDDIAKAVTDKLKITLLKKEVQVNGEAYIPKIEAYEFLLKGRFFLSRRGAGIRTALSFFHQSIEADPLFALAHAAYADANILLATYGILPPSEVMMNAKQSAERAIILNPLLAEPYCTLGYYYNYLEWNWPKAKKNFLRSIELNPSYAEAHYRFGQNYLVCVEGKFEEALEHTTQAIRIEPLSSICYGSHSIVLYNAGKYTEAIEACKYGIELDGNSFLCHLNAGCSLITLRAFTEAISFLETALRISNRHHFAVNGLIWCYCLLGEYDKANELMNELMKRSATEYIAKTFTALSAAYLNDIDKAFEFLEMAFNDHDPILLLLKYADWVPSSVRTDPRFFDLIKRIGLPEGK
jgi:TolB-like protein/Tfp pilus assembly protein PilF